MVLEDGSVQIDLAGKDVEVERSGLEYVVRNNVAGIPFCGNAFNRRESKPLPPGPRKSRV